MNIDGIGFIHSKYRGISGLGQLLSDGWSTPEMTSSGIPAYHVSKELFKGEAVLKSLRRADAFSKMAVVAAHDALADSGQKVSESLGLIVATAFGPHATTFSFLDDIIEYGEKSVSPTKFSHSVHNSAAAYIAKVLGINGVVTTVTQFSYSFYQALLLADCWMSEGRCKYVLVGAVDECSQAMEYICSQKLDVVSDGKLKPFDFSSKPVSVPAEGTVFFLLSKSDSRRQYGSLTVGEQGGVAPAACIFNANGILDSEVQYKSLDDHYSQLLSYTPLFGSTACGEVFDCAVAAYMLREQKMFQPPFVSTTLNVPEPFETLDCVKYYAAGEKRVIRLTQ